MDQEKIWDYFQNNLPESFHGSYGRLSYLLRDMQPSMKVLNIGIGGGVLERLALQKNIDIYAVDPNEKTVSKIQELIGKEKAQVGYGQNLPFDDTFFDVVIISEVLEHLNDSIIDKTLQEIYRVLKKGGKLIGTVPYNENLQEQIVVCPKCSEVFHRWGHVQSFDERRMQELLEKHFQNVQVHPKMFVSWRTLNWKGKIAALLLYVAYLCKIKKSGLSLYFEGKKE